MAIQNRDRPLVIDFYATWCGPCLLLAKELEQVSSLTPGHSTRMLVTCTKGLQASTRCRALTLHTLLCHLMGLASRPQMPPLDVFKSN